MKNTAILASFTKAEEQQKRGRPGKKTYHINTSDGYSVNMGGGVHIQIAIAECSGKKLTRGFT